MIILFGAEATPRVRNLVKDALGEGGWQFAPIHSPPLSATPGNVVTIMGSSALAKYQAAGVFPKNRGIEALRETPKKMDTGGHLMVTYSPMLMLSEADAGPKITWDLRLSRRVEQTGSVEAVIGKYKWLTGPAQFLKLVNLIVERAKQRGSLAVTFDTETMGLVPFQPGKKIVTLQVSAHEGEAFAIHLLNTCKTPYDHAIIVEALTLLFNTPEIKLRGANLKYDLIWVRVQYGVLCTNFTMDSLIVGSCLNENRSNSLSWHAKEHTDMGGYDLAFDCVAPATKLLRADFTWAEAGSVAVGDRLVGFDEEPITGNSTRRMRVAVVEKSARIVKRCMRVTLDTGQSIVCSEDHLWLSRPRSVESGAWEWRTSRDLRLGAQLRQAVPFVDSQMDYDAGWMAGFLDGEGYVSKGGHTTAAGEQGFGLGWSQKAGPVYDRAARLAEHWGLQVNKGGQAGGTNGDVLTAKLSQWDALSLLVRTRPIRLLAKEPWDGSGLPVMGAVSRVVALETVGEHEVVAIQTTVRTFVAEGLCSHNCKYDKGEMEKVPQDDPLFLTYAAGDADAALRVSNYQVAELKKVPKLGRFYTTLLHPAVRAFENIEHRGVHVDLGKFHELDKELDKEIVEQHDTAMGKVPKALKMRYLDNLKLSRPALLEALLFSPSGMNLKPLKYTPKSQKAFELGQIKANERKPAVDRAHLQLLRAAYPDAAEFINPYFLWKNAAKMKSTYVVGFLKHLRADGKFHPTYFLFNGEGEDEDDAGGTDTGRLTCIAPAMQVIPKHAKKGMKNWAKLIRQCFPAPPGYVFCEFDFSQGELRIVACVAGETNMIQAYLKGMDLHCLTGAGAAGMPYDQFYEAYKRADSKDPTLDPKLKELVERFRQQAKSANFGLLYGMGVEGFMIYARDVYGVTLTMEEAEKVRNAFFKSYPGLVKYHARQKNYAGEHGEVVSPLGRVRHLPLIGSSDNAVRSLAQRQAINSPIQATLSDMNLWSIAFIEQRWGHGDDVLMIGSTHDSIYGYLKADKHVELAREITAIMSNLPLEKLGWTPPLTFPADCKVGPSMGDLSTLKLTA